MKPLPLDELWQEIVRKYNRKPDGWQFLIGRDRSGFYDGIVTSSEDFWHIKLDTLFKPNPIALGVKIDEDPSKIKNFSPISYGFRDIPIETLLSSLKHLTQTDPETATRAFTEHLSIILNSAPRPFSDNPQIHGPIIHSAYPIEPISNYQKELSLKMDSELKRLIRARYPSYG